MNPNDDEFLDPNINFRILMAELRDRIEKLKLDTIHTHDPELKGIAEKKYIELKIEYFNLMSKDLELQKMFNEEVSNE